MKCEICKDVIEISFECQECGNNGLCDDCARECAATDKDDIYYTQEYDEFSDADPGL